MRQGPTTSGSNANKRSLFVENPNADTNVKIQTPHWQTKKDGRNGKLPLTLDGISKTQGSEYRFGQQSHTWTNESLRSPQNAHRMPNIGGNKRGSFNQNINVMSGRTITMQGDSALSTAEHHA